MNASDNGGYEIDGGLRINGVGSGQISYASIQSVTLEAAQEGVRYTPVGLSIKVDKTDGTSVIVITRIQSEAATTQNYYDSLPLTVSGEALVRSAANDAAWEAAA